LKQNLFEEKEKKKEIHFGVKGSGIFSLDIEKKEGRRLLDFIFILFAFSLFSIIINK